MADGRIRVGIGGWNYEPWRGTFFPPGLPKTRELDHASRQVTAIEINGTYYGSQKPETFAKWRDAVPDDFVFTVKASRFCTNRKILAEAGGSIEKFLTQGITELGAKLGPILWQFAATKTFDEADIAAFLALLPDKQDGVALRHALEVRHDSFDDPRFVALARRHNAAIVYADTKYPTLAEQTADFTYARLLGSVEAEPLGYPAADLDRWAETARQWAKNGRDVFVFFIAGEKARNPAAAMALIDRLRTSA
ncbi:DUF72 domain-containing protein [Allosphingosinicella flava]|uniref:DUF72 domain-containing protein n=1 Tax=Allosphingosinicella flava TaxID=2771430 RepID=A0A7T2LLL0_9SPHN|nr:DUF72 domain-containing protein [Sphingosinicella flava]QPQ54488.1 DUF72 domain-containing protein [Sphingosinicella flava]